MSLEKIFFSYSRVDGSEFTLKLALDLKAQGFHVWIDQQDIRAGSEWDLEIEKALETCDCLLFIESEKSVVSNNVLDEVYYALEQHKKVIPIIFHDSKTPYRIQRLQHVDFTKDYQKALAQLINELNGISNKEVAANTTMPLSPKRSWLLWISLPVLVIIGVIIFYARSSTQKTIDTPVPEKVYIPEYFAGYWELMSVEPAVRLKDGFLKIEALSEKMVKINSTLQFYYFKTKDTAGLSVFNGFAFCPSCTLQRNMSLMTEDVALGTQTYTVLQHDSFEGKAGDTIVGSGYNKSISASSSLEFISDTTAILTVRSTNAFTLLPAVRVEPFVYSFRFRKRP